MMSRGLVMNKQELLQIIEQLPERFDPELLIRQLYLKAKLERAEDAVERGDVVSHDEVVKRSRQWFE
jgi:predicted transcriptional regulator